MPGLFGRKFKEAREEDEASMGEGVNQGRRPELVGGGVIRSLGGWDEVKKVRKKGQDRIKGDQRILGDSDFVMDVLAQAEERFTRSYEWKSRGYDLGVVEKKGCDIFGIEPPELSSNSREKARAVARGLYGYWAVRELGSSQADMASGFNMTISGVGYAVKRGERLENEFGYALDG